MKNIILLLTATLSLHFASSQITYQSTLTPQQLVQNVLIGTGVTATNIKYNGSVPNASLVQTAAKKFTSSNFPFTTGVYLRTQNATQVNYVSNDPDLNAISTNSVENGVILEFDFVATGNYLSFNYMFASAEYPDYVCSDYNDVFGFFISGAGINGPYSNNALNLALIPGGNIPVAINTVNSGTPGLWGQALYCSNQDPNWQSNSQYFTSQYGTYSNQDYGGGTVSLPAITNLVCGETYHIKLAVSNVGDEALDSGVYLEGGSFTVNPIEFTFNTYTLDNVVYEGCNQLGTIMYTRAGCGNENDTIVAYVSFTGTAVNGSDYQQLGDSVILLPGVDTLFWQILPYEDGLTEGVEDILVSLYTIINGDTLYGSGTFYISDVPIINVNAQDITYKCFQDSSDIMATVTGGFAPYSYDWSSGDTTLNASVYIPGNGITGYLLTVTDACGYIKSDSAYVTMNQTISIDSIQMGPATCEPVGWVYASVSGQTNPIHITFDWTNSNGNAIPFNQSTLSNLGGGWYYLTLTDDNIPCSVDDSIFVETINTPVALASANPSSGCSPVTSIFSNNSQNAGSYIWDFGNGNVISTSDMSNISQTYYNDATITLIASNGNHICDDTISLTVDIVTCGCMDPNALNYNPLAVQSGEECIYPTPTVVAPNVITANGDNINAYFFLETTYAESIELMILNRWGNLIYTGTGTQNIPPYWDGNDKSGKSVEEGVYFYRYKVTGKLGDELEGHGFVEVVR